MKIVVVPLALLLGGCGVVRPDSAQVPPCTDTTARCTRPCVTTLAGSGAIGALDGPAAAATFDAPWGAAIDATGRVYISELKGGRIRAVCAGKVTTFAGTGGFKHVDGPSAVAAFKGPAGLAVDGVVVYVADANAHVVRKIAGGQVSTFAGVAKVEGAVDGPLARARFRVPFAVAVAPDKSLVVADSLNHRVRRIANGQVTTVAGSAAGFANGVGAAAKFEQPRGIAVGSDGRIYVADTGNSVIRVIERDGRVALLAGSGLEGFADGPAERARFLRPSGLAVDSSGAVFVTTETGNRIRRIADGRVTTVAGTGAAPSRFGDSTFADGPAGLAQLGAPAGLARDPATGSFVFSDTVNRRVRVFIP